MIDLLLNWGEHATEPPLLPLHSNKDITMHKPTTLTGPIIGMLFFPVQIMIARQRDGLRRCLVISIWLAVVANVVRALPMLVAQVTGRDAYRQSDLAFACYHFGAILIAASGPLNMGSVTHLSATVSGASHTLLRRHPPRRPRMS